MALKTFNIDETVYKEFSDHCKKNGISMSKKIENFIREEMNKIAPISIGKIAKKEIIKDNHPMGKYC